MPSLPFARFSTDAVRSADMRMVPAMVRLAWYEANIYAFSIASVEDDRARLRGGWKGRKALAGVLGVPTSSLEALPAHDLAEVAGDDLILLRVAGAGLEARGLDGSTSGRRPLSEAQRRQRSEAIKARWSRPAPPPADTERIRRMVRRGYGAIRRTVRNGYGAIRNFTGRIRRGYGAWGVRGEIYQRLSKKLKT